ncbi:MAG: hypothetical protein ACOCPW_04085 [Marinilabiliaceae bacterium]
MSLLTKEFWTTSGAVDFYSCTDPRADPMVAMCATRLNEPEIALDGLLYDVQKNTYLVNGHNYQDENLRIICPGMAGF